MITKAELKNALPLLYAFLLEQKEMDKYIDGVNTSRETSMGIQSIKDTPLWMQLDSVMDWEHTKNTSGFWIKLDRKWCTLTESSPYGIAQELYAEAPDFMYFLISENKLFEYCKLFEADRDWENIEELVYGGSKEDYVQVGITWPVQDRYMWDVINSRWMEMCREQNI